MGFGAFERRLAPSDAVKQAFALLDSLGVKHELKTVGDRIQTVECRLTDASDRVFIGRGKGLGTQSVASAVFESIEHFRYRTAPVSAEDALQGLDLAGNDHRLANSTPDWNLVCGGRPIPLTRIRFSPIGGSEPDLLFPAILQNPDFAPENEEEAAAIRTHRLRRYGTNSGTAAGADAEDAALHAILEIIERDSIGIELLRTVIRREPHDVRELDAASFSDDLAALVHLASRETEASLRFWDITTDLGVPSILCALRPVGSNEARTYFGSGASLSPAYAVERALLEAVQTCQIHRLLGVALPPALEGPIGGRPLFDRCYLDAGCFGYRGGTTSVDLNTVHGPATAPESLTPAAQVRLLVDRLAHRSVRVYVRHLSHDCAPVVQVVAPRLERFHLTSYGIAVVPGARGRAILDAA